MTAGSSYLIEEGFRAVVRLGLKNLIHNRALSFEIVKLKTSTFHTHNFESVRSTAARRDAVRRRLDKENHIFGTLQHHCVISTSSYTGGLASCFGDCSGTSSYLERFAETAVTEDCGN